MIYLVISSSISSAVKSSRRNLLKDHRYHPDITSLREIHLGATVEDELKFRSPLKTIADINQEND